MIVEKVKQLETVFNNFNPDDKKYLGFFPVPDKDKVKQFLSKGRWTILITDTHPKFQLAHGLRIIPNLVSDLWPVYELTQINTAFLLTPNIASYVTFSHYRTLRRIQGKHESYQSNWDKYVSILLPYYSHFGKENTIDELREYVNNEKYWVAESKGELSDDDYVFYMSKHSNSDNVSFIISLIDKLEADKNFIPGIPEKELGIWKSRVLNIIGERATIRATSDRNPTEVENQIFEYFKQPHGYDTEDIAVKIQPNDSASSQQQFWQLVNGFISYSNRTHPLGITDQPEYIALLALKEKGQGGYQGVEHIEAAAILDSEMNEPVRAWNCLLSAGYWAGLNKPELQTTIMEAAIYLCRKHNWIEAADSVQYNLDLLNS